MPSKKTAGILKLIARILSIILILFTFLFMAGYAVQDEPFRFKDILKIFLFFPIGVFLGYIISWKWEIPGAFLAMICLIIFQLTQQGPPLMLIYAVPPVLYFLASFLSRS